MCQQVFNTNGQYECVAAPSPTPATASTISPSTSPIAAVPAGCQSCASGQTCEQVYNSNEYHCVDSSPTAVTSLAASTSPPAAAKSPPAGCQACFASQLCEQVYNSQQYHCVDSSPISAAPTPSNSNISSSSACNPECSEDESCEQVFNRRQYMCQPQKQSTSPMATSVPAAAAQPPTIASNISAATTPMLPNATIPDQAPNLSPSQAGLSVE